MVVYKGDMKSDADFNPSMLSAVFGQVKLRIKCDKDAEQAVRPFGLARDIVAPLPYLALILELGDNSKYQKTRSNLEILVPEYTDAADLAIRKHEWERADVDKWKKHRVRGNNSKVVKNMRNKRMKMDGCNRFSISVRGTSCYGILNKLQVAEQFKSLLDITLPPPNEQDKVIQHMRPLERLRGEHVAWMSNFTYADRDSEEDMDVDSDVTDVEE